MPSTPHSTLAAATTIAASSTAVHDLLAPTPASELKPSYNTFGFDPPPEHYEDDFWMIYDEYVTQPERREQQHRQEQQQWR